MRCALMSLVLWAAASCVAQTAMPAAGPEQQLPMWARLALPASSAEKSEVREVLIARTGTVVAARYRDRKLRIWSMPMAELRHAIDLPPRVQLTAISDDGRYILTATYDGNASVWDTGTGSAAFAFKLAHYPGIAVFSHDSKLLAITAERGPVQVMDIAGKAERFRLPEGLGIEAVAFSPDDSLIATAGGDTTVKIYDARSRKLVSENRDFLLEPLALDFTSDGKQVVAGGGDRVIVFIDVTSGRAVRRLEKGAEPPVLLGVSPNGKLLVAGYIIADNMGLPTPVAIFDLATGAKKTDIVPRIALLGGAWLNDGRCVVAIAPDKQIVELRVLY